jgi:hypothetical protein
MEGGIDLEMAALSAMRVTIVSDSRPNVMIKSLSTSHVLVSWGRRPSKRKLSWRGRAGGGGVELNILQADGWC